MKARLVFLIGFGVLVAGLLFTLQGAGLVAWPRESFMVDNHDWIGRGLVIALIGAGLILTAWRLQKKL